MNLLSDGRSSQFKNFVQFYMGTQVSPALVRRPFGPTWSSILPLYWGASRTRRSADQIVREYLCTHRFKIFEWLRGQSCTGPWILDNPFDQSEDKIGMDFKFIIWKWFICSRGWALYDLIELSRRRSETLGNDSKAKLWGARTQKRPFRHFILKIFSKNTQKSLKEIYNLETEEP